MRRSLPTLRGRRDSSRPDPAGALAAVIARAAACFDSGPGALPERIDLSQPSQRPRR